jgi:tRNA-dihydrouridine synthase B
MGTGLQDRRAPLEPLRIRGLSIDPPLVLAPLSGYTDTAFRVLCRRHGAGMVWTELISAYGVVYRNRKSLAMLCIREEERPIAIQLFGSDPEVMTRAARIAAERRPDAIDINMGCTVPKVTKTGAGAALLRDPARAQRIAASVAKAVDVPVTVKIRSGWDSGSINLVEIAGRCEDAGAAAVVLHARTAAQKMRGKADWSRIAELKESLGIPVIGNGDATSIADARRMIEQTGCDAVMIGRAALRDPGLFEAESKRREADFKGIEERVALALEHLRLAREYIQSESARHLRGHLMYMVSDFPGAKELRRKISKTETIGQAEELLASAAQEQG